MDSRFYEILGPVSVGDLTQIAGLDASGLDLSFATRMIAGVAPHDRAGPEHLTFSEKPVEHSPAGLVFAPKGSKAQNCVIAPSPRLAYTLAAVRLGRPKQFASGAPMLAKDAQIGSNVRIAPGAVIAPGAQIGDDSVIGAGAVIGHGVCIGRNCDIGPNAAIGFSLIGDGVVVQMCGVVGENGFGIVPSPSGLLNVPHFGRVIVQEGAAIGANTYVARGTLDDTQIGPAAKIGDLCTIAHNVSVGANAVIVSHSGVSGSVTIGDGAILAGGVGVADHVTIGAGAKIAARSGIAGDIPAGQSWGGYPARPSKQWAREAAWVKLQVENRHKKP